MFLGTMSVTIEQADLGLVTPQCPSKEAQDARLASLAGKQRRGDRLCRRIGGRLVDERIPYQIRNRNLRIVLDCHVPGHRPDE